MTGRSRDMETPVLIVGAGPVGLTLASDLAFRGIETTVLELRAAGEPPSVKCNHVSARSMEVFRRLGIANRIRDTGLPPEFPIDGTWGTSFVAKEFCRISVPSRAARARGESSLDGSWPTPEPPHRINQTYLEPILFQHAASLPEIEILDLTEFLRLEQDEAGVTATVRGLDSNEEIRIRSRYLVGCDGPASRVRRAIGAKFEGQPGVAWASALIRAPSLLGLLEREPSWSAWVENSTRDGTVFAIDGKDLWLVHARLRPGERREDLDQDQMLRTILGVPPHFEYELLSTEGWTAARLVSSRFRDRRVFLAGDAAHVWMPLAGYGMNAGIADAIDLSWQLAGVLRGWASPSVLDAYEIERRQITTKVSTIVTDMLQRIIEHRTSAPSDLVLQSSESPLRRKYVEETYELNLPQFFCAGFNFGYCYERSPIIAYDDAAPLPLTMGEYVPSTAPGCRTPHLWLSDGGSLNDALGPDWTLLRFEPSLDVAPLCEAASRRAMPLVVLDIDPAIARGTYDRKLVLSRPDQHVAWRGDALPSDPLVLVDRIRGASTPSA